MSRSGYTDDYDEDGQGGLWRGAVARSIAGKRGQAALLELAQALDAMPQKALAAESLITAEGEYCTLGVLGAARGLDMKGIDAQNWDFVAAALNLAPAMVREIVNENDGIQDLHDEVTMTVCGPMRPWFPDYNNHVKKFYVELDETEIAKRRWKIMRRWVGEHTKAATFAVGVSA